MTTHRYWRAVSLESYAGGALEITGFHLLSGTTRVDVPATLTASISPATGAVTYLQDADTSTGATWPIPTGLMLQWDFGGSPVDVTDIRLGAADDPTKFPLLALLQWSDDGTTWSLGFEAYGISWPGGRSLTVSDLKGYWVPSPFTSLSVYLSIDRTRRNAGGQYSNVLADASANSGVLQFEVTINNANSVVGVSKANFPYAQTIVVDSDSWVIYTASKSNGSPVAYAGAVPAIGDVIGVVVDFTAGTITFYINGVSKGVAFSNLAGLTLFPTFGGNGGAYIAVGNTLRTQNFTYPVAGASPWLSGSLIRRNDVRGRVQQVKPFIAPAGGATPIGANQIFSL